MYRQRMIGRTLFFQGMEGIGAGSIPLAIQAFREAIAIARATGDKLTLGYSLELYYTATDFISAPDQDEAALEGFHIFSHEINDNFGLMIASMNMARIAAEKANDAEKEMYYRRVKERLREIPGSYQVGMFHLGMGFDERSRGNFEAAKKIFEDGLQIFRNQRNMNMQLALRSEIGHTEREMGNLSQAKAIYLETIRDWQKVGNRSAIAHQLECFGFLAIADEEPQRAAKLFSAAEALRERSASPMRDQEHVEYDRSVMQLRSMLPEADFNALWAEGRTMTMEQAIELAVS